MTSEEIVEKWAKCILVKFNWNPEDEYKRLEVMNAMMLCFHEMLQ